MSPIQDDVFGQLLERFHFLGDIDAVEVIQRDDGYCSSSSIGKYFARVNDWSMLDREVLDACSGAVLDIGAGAGRFARALDRRGNPVTCIDQSPGAIRVTSDFGLPSYCLRFSDIDDYEGTFDTVLLAGQNVGLFGSSAGVAAGLKSIRRLLRPQGRVVLSGVAPGLLQSGIHKSYMDRNRRAGVDLGLQRIRIGDGKAWSAWFDYLFISANELSYLLVEEGWAIVSKTHVAAEYCIVATVPVLNDSPIVGAHETDTKDLELSGGRDGF